MNEERVLSLDISSKTGWCLLISKKEGIQLEDYGQVPQIHMPDGPYPDSFVDWAYAVYGKILEIIDNTHPDVLVIEETAAGSKAIYTQKFLEFCHFLVAKLIKETKIKVIYLMTEQWRRETGCQMSKAESKHNKKVRDFKKAYKEKYGKKTTIAYDENGKRIGLKSRKHVNIRRANEVFGAFLKAPLLKKDEDAADSLMLAYCYHLRRMKIANISNSSP